MVLRGEPGIGKSGLAAAAAGLAEDSGAVVLTLAGSALHTDAGLHPVRSCSNAVAASSRLDPSWRAAVAARSRAGRPADWTR